MRLLLAVVVVGLLNTPLLHEATAAPVTTAALRITPTTSSNPGQEIVTAQPGISTVAPRST
jgi:hypothetical protein